MVKYFFTFTENVISQKVLKSGDKHVFFTIS